MMKSLAQLAFVVGLMLLFVLCLTPGQEMPDIGTSDKLLHGAAFLMLAFAGRLAFPASSRSGWALLGGLIAIGAGIEFAQMLVPGRSADAADWLADSLGVIAGLGLGEILRRSLGRFLSGAPAQ